MWVLDVIDDNIALFICIHMELYLLCNNVCSIRPISIIKITYLCSSVLDEAIGGPNSELVVEQIDLLKDLKQNSKYVLEKSFLRSWIVLLK